MILQNLILFLREFEMIKKGKQFEEENNFF